MFRPRVIPTLLLKNLGLVKTVKFKKPNYIGDPINAVKIFNDLKADELILLDISATRQNRSISQKFVQEVGGEAFMPFAVGGGISTIDEAGNCINCGSEKIVLDSHAVMNPDLITQCAEKFGSQSVIVSLDVKKNFFGEYCLYIKNGRKKTKYNPLTWAIIVSELGAGEILINNIDNDGIMSGYDLDLIKLISKSVNIPVIASGGAGEYADFKLAIDAGAHAVAAGSLFVYQGPRKGVLINYPIASDLMKIFS